MKPLGTWWARLTTRTGPALVPIRVVGRAALGPGHAVFIVDIEGRRMVIGTAPQTITRLGTLEPRAPEHER